MQLTLFTGLQMIHIFYKLLFLLLISIIHIQASTQTTINKEITTLKEKLNKIEITYNTKNQYIDKDFQLLKDDIKNLENKLEKESIDKNSIQKDYDNFNNIIERQDNSINRLSIIISCFGILVTLLVIYFSFRNEGVARSVASKEIADLKPTIKKDIDNMVDSYEVIFDRHLNDALSKLEHIKEIDKNVENLFNTINKKDLSVDELNIVNEKAKNAGRVKDEVRTEQEWEELFLSAYYAKEYEKAIDYSTEIVKINPTDIAYYNMGLIYHYLDKYEEAIECYKKSLELNPKKDDAYNNMGTTYRKLGKEQEAIESYKQAIEINPKQNDAYYNMGNAYDDIGKYEKAIELYTKAIEINPKDDGSYYNMGNTYRKLGKYEESIELYKKSIEINPEDDDSYHNMGNAYRKLDKYEESIESYKKAIEIDPKDEESYYNLGFTYSKLGKYEESKESYIKVLELTTKDSIFKEDILGFIKELEAKLNK